MHPMRGPGPPSRPYRHRLTRAVLDSRNPPSGGEDLPRHLTGEFQGLELVQLYRVMSLLSVWHASAFVPLDLTQDLGLDSFVG